MKKKLIVFLCSILLFSLSGCEQKEKSDVLPSSFDPLPLEINILSVENGKTLILDNSLDVKTIKAILEDSNFATTKEYADTSKWKECYELNY